MPIGAQRPFVADYRVPDTKTQGVKLVATNAPVTTQIAGETDRTAKWALLLGSLLLAGGTALLFMAWAVFTVPSQGTGFLGFGRLYPMAMTLTVFGGFVALNLGVLLFLLPRLTGAAPKKINLISKLVWLAAGASIAGVLVVGFGGTDGRQGFELPWWSELLLISALIGVALITIQALFDAKEDSIYPSVWFITGGLLSFIAAIVIANFTLATGPGAAIPVGFGRGVVLWVWILGSAIGAVLYLVPKESGRPLFSRQIAIGTFASLLLVGMFYGLSTTLFGPLPDWAETVGISMGLLLVVPAVTVPTLVVRTLDGAFDQLETSIPLRFAVAGSVAFSLGALVSAVSGLRSFAQVLGLTTFRDGTETLLVFGAGVLMISAFVYHAVPRLTGRTLHSEHLAKRHLQFTVIGAGGLTLLLWLGGIATGSTWLAGIESGSFSASGEGFSAALTATTWSYPWLLLSAFILFIGQLIFVTNLYRTLVSSDAAPVEMIVEDDQ
jgi:cytochrome c oxidase cbb3-type subunit 1